MKIMSSPRSAIDIPSFTYPRTGKRGVPQQFPRRLSEMLECEAQLARTDPNHKCIITWSDSGKAFRILNVALFSSRILPKYFRTSKFSSFQRNLNLVRVHRFIRQVNVDTLPNILVLACLLQYGFCKVRRGPDTDMYAHPAFVRGQPETLSQLRKCNSSVARKRLTNTSKTEHNTASPAGAVAYSNSLGITRTVSPSPSTMADNGGYHHVHIEPMPSRLMGMSRPSIYTPMLMHTVQRQPTTAPAPVSPGRSGSGRLDLLALALTSMAERDAAIGANATAIETA